MTGREDPTRLTHFEPLSPVTAPAQGGVFKFFGRLFRTDAEESSPTASANSSGSPSLYSGQGESDANATSDVTDSPKSSKAPNGAAGQESASIDREARRRVHHSAADGGGDTNVNPSSFGQLPQFPSSISMGVEKNGQTGGGRAERSKLPLPVDASSPRPQSLGYASPARRGVVGAEQGVILRQVPKSRRLADVKQRLSGLLRGPFSTSGMTSGSSMESIESGLLDYDRSDFRQYWMPDSRGKECYECQEKFTAFRRRHHCRICGQIFCAKCCNMEVPGALLGYMGDLRLCNYCSKAVVSYLSTADGDRGGRSPSPPQDEPHIVRKDSSASAASAIRTTASSADISTVSGAIMWAPPESHARSSSVVEGPTVLSVLDLAAGTRPLPEPVEEEPTLAQAVDEWEPEWVKSIDISDRRLNKLTEADPGVEKNESFNVKDFTSASLSDQLQPLSIATADEHLSVARTLPALAPIPPSPTVTDAIDSALSQDSVGETVNLPILYESQSMRLLQYVLDRENLDCERWMNVIWPLSREIAYTVHPNVRDRRDDMDILSYIHVKKLLTSREKPSAQVVFGTVCSKAVADSRMKQQLTHPSVMVIGGSIEYERVGGKFSSIDPIIMQETEYLKNIVARLSARRPAIVVVEKTVARLALKFLRRAGVTVLFNLKSAVLKRIARCTQADVTPSVDSQILLPKLGSCGLFRSEMVSLLNGDTKSLVYFDDCQPDLSCSIVLHGADPRELRAAKRVIRFMVSVLYSAKLETEMLRLNEVCIEPEHGGLCDETDCCVCILNADDAFVANDDGVADSLAVAGQSAVLTSSPLIMFGLPFLETKRGRGCRLTAYFKQPLYRFLPMGSMTPQRTGSPEMTNALPPKRQIELSVTPETTHSYVHEKVTGLDLGGIANYRARSGRLFRRRYADAVAKDGRSPAQSHQRDTSPTAKKRLPLPSGAVDVLCPYYHQRIAVLFGSYSTKSANAPLFCVRPWVVWMEFYGVHDMCLGEFLKKFCFNKEYQCPSVNCDVPMLDHARKIVHRRVCIEITTQTIMEQDQPSSIPQVDADDQMLTWDWCSKCKHTTKALPVSDKMWHLSFAKYLDYLSSGRHLRSHAVGSDTVTICSHCMFHEHDHYFVLNNFVTCFKLSPVRPFEVTFSPMICKVKPTVVPAQTLFDSARSLSDKAADVFGTLAERRNKFVQNPESTRYAATVAMLATVLDEAQESFRSKMGALQDHLSSLDGRTLGTNDAYFIKAYDNLTVCEQLVAHAVTQWNICATDFVQAVKLNKKAANASTSVITDLPKDIKPSYSAPILELAAPIDEKALKELDEKARQLSPAKSIGPLELPTLSNPFNRGEHFELPFGRIPVVIRDLVETKTCQADIGSIIAYALASSEYDSKRQRLRDTWGQDGVALSLKRSSLNDSNDEQQSLTSIDATGQDSSGQDDSTSQHIELQFADATAKYYCKVYYAEHFRLLRKLLFAEGEDAFVRSLARSTTWDPQGGKSGASFYRTEDGRFVFKQMSRFEIQSFLKFAPNYFHYVSTAATENKLTTLCKVYGVYRIGYKNFQTGQQLKLDVLVMEYLFYRRNVKQVWDLKGSQRNRMASEKETSDLVLLDENLLKDLWNNQLYVHPHSKTALSIAISNDSHFLSGQLVMDYSLLVGVDEERQELVLGIVDYMRTYTLDKKLESWVKIVAVPGAHLPTVISPEMYCTRFSEAIDTYFPVAPDQWTGLGYGMPY